MNELQQIWLKAYNDYLNAQISAYAIPGIKREVQPFWLTKAKEHADSVINSLKGCDL